MAAPRKPRRTAAKSAQPEISPTPKAPPPARGCTPYRDPECEADRIHDWERARFDIAALLKKRKIHLCPAHLARHRGEEPQTHDEKATSTDSTG